MIRSCTLELASLSEADLGSWVCRIHHTASTQFQEATLEIAINPRDIDVRLPQTIRCSMVES